MSNIREIPVSSAKAIRLKKDQTIKIINTYGHQVVDTWAFNAVNLAEFLSTEHTRQKLDSIFPKLKNPLFTNKRRSIVILEEDTSPGVHDMLMAACDIYRYQQLGCDTYHKNCTDNLHAALGKLDLKIPNTPSPINLWMNIPVNNKGDCQWKPPKSKAGDYVCLRSTMDCVVVMSACPQDLIPINAGNPVAVHFEIINH